MRSPRIPSAETISYRTYRKYFLDLRGRLELELTSNFSSLSSKSRSAPIAGDTAGAYIDSVVDIADEFRRNRVREPDEIETRATDPGRVSLWSFGALFDTLAALERSVEPSEPEFNERL